MTNNTQENSAPVKKLVKSIQHTLNLDSEQLFLYLQEEGGKSTGALERIGSLLRMLAKEEDLSGAVGKWMESIFDEANEDVDKLLTQKDSLMEKVDMSVFTISVPDSYFFNFEIAHPSVWKLINLIGRIDGELNDIENIWLAGEISDIQLFQAKTQALAILRRTIHKIFSATSPGKREGGRFSPLKFIGIMRQVKGMPEIVVKPIEQQEKPVKEVVAKEKPVKEKPAKEKPAKEKSAKKAQVKETIKPEAA